MAKLNAVHLEDVLMRGSCVRGWEERVINFFKTEKLSKKRAEFLKAEFGIGGFTASGVWEQHDSRGLSYGEGPAFLTHVTWLQVAITMDVLIRNGKIGSADIKKLANMHRLTPKAAPEATITPVPTGKYVQISFFD